MDTSLFIKIGMGAIIGVISVSIARDKELTKKSDVTTNTLLNNKEDSTTS